MTNYLDRRNKKQELPEILTPEEIPYPNLDYTKVGELEYEMAHKQRDAFMQGARAQLAKCNKRLDNKELREFTAWAIDTQSTEGHGLLGRYFFDNHIQKPPSLEGCITALFITRAIARQYCKTVYRGNTWKPKVIKVRVIIQNADQLLALFDIEEIRRQGYNEGFADAENYRFKGNQLLDDVKEKAKRKERIREESHTLAQLRYYLSQQPISDLWDDIEGYCQSLEGELQSLRGGK